MRKAETLKINLNIQSRLLVLRMIRLYQGTLSPDHGPFKYVVATKCKFSPTCSDYSYQSIEKYGVIKGGAKAVWRVLRCNPFSKGGHDPVK